MPEIDVWPVAQRTLDTLRIEEENAVLQAVQTAARSGLGTPMLRTPESLSEQAPGGQAYGVDVRIDFWRVRAYYSYEEDEARLTIRGVDLRYISPQ